MPLQDILSAANEIEAQSFAPDGRLVEEKHFRENDGGGGSEYASERSGSPQDRTMSTYYFA